MLFRSCAVNCPVDINTGELVKRLRKENHSRFQQWVAKQFAQHFSFLEGTMRLLIRFSLLMNQLFGKRFMTSLTGGIKRMIPSFPLWNNQIKAPGSRLRSLNIEQPYQQVVYFTSCISRMMGGQTGDQFLKVCQRASISVIIPEQINSMCCGQVFSSKGFTDAFRETANATIEKLWKTSLQEIGRAHV